MHKAYKFTSVFAFLLNNYIIARREAGFEFDNPAYWLYRFDQFCFDLNILDINISKQLYDRWSQKINKEAKITQANRLQALKGFCLYLNTLGVQCYIPKRLPKPEKIVPYLMTDKDILSFFAQVDSYETDLPFIAFKRMAIEYKVIFRLIYCCGLRNNEACSLRMRNIDLENGSITLNHTKGNKERLVYISDDLRLLCIEYLSCLTNEFNLTTTEWFFPGRNPENQILKTTIDFKFNEFWNRTETSKMVDKKPTVHSLRHAFVIKRVNLWMENGISLCQMMPYLSNFLGHKGPLETFYYYHLVEDVFKTVHEKDTTSAKVIPEVQYEK